MNMMVQAKYTRELVGSVSSMHVDTLSRRIASINRMALVASLVVTVQVYIP